MVADANRCAVGIKPEGSIRWLVIDIDAKQGRRSPYWDKHGRNLYLQALQAAAEAAGCRTVLIRSSHSNGLHLWILLPEHQPAWLVHHIGVELTACAGMHKLAAYCEVFPSLMPYVKGKPLPRSNGIRLPGGKGSALIVDGELNSDPEAIYEALQQAVDATESNPRWDALVSNAHARGLASNAESWSRKTPYGKLRASMPGPWTGSGQSNYLTGELTKVAMAEMAGHPDEAIIRRAIELIESHPGYQEHASSDTKRVVANGSKVAGWIKTVRTRIGAVGIDERPRNSNHNAEQMDRVRRSLTELLQTFGRSVLGWSKRELQRASGLNWRTVLKWWDRLEELCEQVMHTPPIKALHHVGADLEPLAVPSVESKSLESVPPVASAEQATSGVHLESQRDGFADGSSGFLSTVLERCRARLNLGFAPVKAVDPTPIKAGGADVIAARRERERAELLAWLGAA
jgi:hypothetical protein